MTRKLWTVTCPVKIVVYAPDAEAARAAAASFLDTDLIQKEVAAFAVSPPTVTPMTLAEVDEATTEVDNLAVLADDEAPDADLDLPLKELFQKGLLQ